MSAVSRNGRCLCGHYRFEVNAPPLWIAYCHCESCRRATGSPVSCYVGVADEAVRFEPAEPPAFHSSPPVTRTFCEHCGTPLFYAAEFFPGELHLFRSNFDRPGDYEPTRHVLFNEHEAGFDVYDDLPRYGTVPRQVIGWGPKPAVRVLFIGTGNSIRSILAEALLNLKNGSVDGIRVRAHSAGSAPTGEVNPRVREMLAPHRSGIDRPHSKSWDAFTDESAPTMDWVITLCDDAAEHCPVFPGDAENRHWELPDPSSGAETLEATRVAIEEAVDAFLADLGAV